MLRLYKPIKDDIFKLHGILEFLVCSVWCKADKNSCDSKMNADFKKLYGYAYGGKKKKLKDEVERIYRKFKRLKEAEKTKIHDAFSRANKIEELCNGNIRPIYLSDLNEIVDKDIKPLFTWFYEKLLDKAKVAGVKLVYYRKLIEANDFEYCPCCGLSDFEQKDSKNREAYDHYLPKSKYPFASVNFLNLIPLCYKCNSDRKKAKDPIEKGRKAYFPFGKSSHDVGITFKINQKKDIDKLERNDLIITFNGDNEKLKTWNSLFDISDRYNDTSRKLSKTLLRQLANRYKRNKKRKQGLSYLQIIDDHIEDYEAEKYSDKKFLKIAFLKELKNCTKLIDVYA